jgi:EmrB/QacA subfamily drug resistance transporter
VAIDRPLCPDGQIALAPETSAPCLEASRPFVLAATILASAMGFIDATVVTIALPAIEQTLAGPFAVLQWVINGYALTLSSLILIGGAAGDLYGRRLVFLTGIVVFAVASAACALAPGAMTLVGARTVQGIGAALMVPQSLAIIAASFPKGVRGRAIGIWAGASAIATSFGPPLGGFLIDALSWHAAFWINLPISGAVIWLTLRHVPESRNKMASGGLDWLGGVLAVVGFGALTLGLSAASSNGPLSAPALTAFAIGAASLAILAVTERRVSQPLLPPELFRNREFVGANLVTLFLYAAFSAVLFLLPFELVARRGFSASAVGLVLLPIGIVIGLFSRRAGRWSDLAGPRPPLVAGSAIVSVAAVLLALVISNVWLGVVGPIVILSAGMAIVVAPLTAAVLNAVPEAETGVASGVNNAASRLAGLFSVAIAGSVAAMLFLQGIESAGAPPQASTEPRFGVLPDLLSPARPAFEAAFLAAYQAGMLIAAALAALAALTAAVSIRARS